MDKKIKDDLGKSVKISKDLHVEVKVHVAKRETGITEFVEKAIRAQLKKESK